MLSKDLQKHAREFSSYLHAKNYEVTEQGVYFPTAHAIARGMYMHTVNGADLRYDPNLLTAEGLTKMLNVHLGTHTKLAAWYFALFSGAVTPSSALTAANFASTLTEITSAVEGYTESTRQAWTPVDAVASSMNNTAAMPTFTIATASQLTVNGCGLLSSNTRGGTSGVVNSATRFASARLLNNGDIFNLGYTVSLASS